MDKMHLQIVEETEWDAAEGVHDPSCMFSAGTFDIGQNVE